MNAKRIYWIKIAPVVLLAGAAYWRLGSDFFNISNLVGDAVSVRTGIYAGNISDVSGI